MVKAKKSQAKKAEEIKNLEDIKSDFITVASHQLKTPISAVRWSLDALLSGKLGKLSVKQAEVLGDAYQNNLFLLKLINDLLRISRLEEKGVQLKPELVDVLGLIKEALKSHADLAQAYNCRFNLRPTGKNFKAYFDSWQLTAIINDLLDNAIMYTRRQGKVSLDLQKTKDYLLFKIKDNGIGIPAGQKAQVFSKFFRARNALKVQAGGLGLDLYLAKRIIEASGGKISFISQENIGTTFKIYLPLSAKDSENGNLTGLIKEEPENILKKEREFVAITVHELKSPLGSSKWSLEMLKSQKPGKLNFKQRELVAEVYRGNQRLLILVRDLLNLAKLQEGKFTIDAKPVKLAPVVAEVLDSFRLEAKRKKINVNFISRQALMPEVLADPGRIAQVATNLVSNALKYTPNNGQVTIKLEKASASELKKMARRAKLVNLTYFDNKKGYLIFSVKDTGMGISLADQKKLFTRFFRSQKALQSQAEGTGLGLYITRSIVNLHGGDIWFASQPGQGSTFYFSLPIAY